MLLTVTSLPISSTSVPVANVYTCDPTGPIGAYATLADRFELLGYVIVGAFVLAWGGAALVWRLGRMDGRYRT